MPSVLSVISPHLPDRPDFDSDLEANPTDALDIRHTEEEGELSDQDKDSSIAELDSMLSQEQP